MADHVTHAYPRAYEAACKVDPMVLAGALDHIAKTAARSYSMSRRIRWIQARAEAALNGNDSPDAGVNLPRSAGPDTPEKLQRRMAYHIAVKHQLLDALKALDLVASTSLDQRPEFIAALKLSAEAIANAEDFNPSTGAVEQDRG